jgi:hypothetical protein
VWVVSFLSKSIAAVLKPTQQCRWWCKNLHKPKLG